MAKRCSIAFLLFISLLSCAAQQSRAYLNYIEKYSDWAVEQMKEYKIPASITLAQGLLESRAGQSRLAVEANNHFGIKVGTGWSGPYIREDDDAKGEKFRKYASARESYIDHSQFLANRSRYASLFSYKTTDYKSWAHGLKACGYATSPTYAQSLIRIIETYNLAEFDSPAASTPAFKFEIKQQIKLELEEATDKLHSVFMNNKNYYVIAEADDTFESIADETGVAPSHLRKYNELPDEYRLQKGDIIYLEGKRSKAEAKYEGELHIIQPGESMYTIAQLYGIKLKSLYKLNKKPKTYSAQVGDGLWVR